MQDKKSCNMQNVNLYSDYYSDYKMPNLIIHNNLLMDANKHIKYNGALATFHSY